MRKQVQEALEALPLMASAYLPTSFKNVLLNMGDEIDHLRMELNQVKQKQEQQQ